MARIVIVPGLAVRSYVEPAAAAARSRGHRVSLLRAPAWAGAPVGPWRYGRVLAEELEARREEVDLLVGLSIGTQAATFATTLSSRVHGLLLVSPTVDPVNRSVPKLLGAWLGGERGAAASQPEGRAAQLRDWARAGVPRIAAGFLSVLQMPIEEVLPSVEVPTTIVFAGSDNLGTLEFSRRLATDNDAELVVEPHAPHSWPVDAPDRFADLVDRLCS